MTAGGAGSRPGDGALGNHRAPRANLFSATFLAVLSIGAAAAVRDPYFIVLACVYSAAAALHWLRIRTVITRDVIRELRGFRYRQVGWVFVSEVLDSPWWRGVRVELRDGEKLTLRGIGREDVDDLRALAASARERADGRSAAQ